MRTDERSHCILHCQKKVTNTKPLNQSENSGLKASYEAALIYREPNMIIDKLATEPVIALRLSTGVCIQYKGARLCMFELQGYKYRKMRFDPISTHNDLVLFETESAAEEFWIQQKSCVCKSSHGPDDLTCTLRELVRKQGDHNDF